MINKYKTHILFVLALAVIFTIAGCQTFGGGRLPPRTAEHQNWDIMFKEMYPNALQLNVERFRSRWGTIVDGDLVTFDGTNYHDFVYVFPANVTLANYSALVLVMEIFDIHKPEGSNSPTRNITFSFRKGPTEVQPFEDNYNSRKIKQFWAANEADYFEFQEHGILVVGISGDDWTNLINDPVHGGGINIHNSIWGNAGSHLNRTGYTMKMRALYLMPKTNPSDFGQKAGEYILDPTLFGRSGQWGGNDGIYDILMLNNNGSIIYNFPRGLDISSYKTMEITYRVLDNSGGDMNVNIWANSHEGSFIATYTLESSGTLQVPLDDIVTGFAVRNNLRRSANSINYVVKIDSIKLVNN